MSKQLSVDDASKSLNGHVALKGAEIHAKYGPHIGWAELSEMLTDRTQVRYPCEIVFDAGPLQEGEFACPIANGEQPEDGYKIYVHPFFATQLSRVSYLILYQLVRVNYGDFASSDDAETFGAAALGLSKEDYYRAVCDMADELSTE